MVPPEPEWAAGRGRLGSLVLERNVGHQARIGTARGIHHVPGELLLVFLVAGGAGIDRLDDQVARIEAAHLGDLVVGDVQPGLAGGRLTLGRRVELRLLTGLRLIAPISRFKSGFPRFGTILTFETSWPPRAA